jgi:hypothetical protein
MSYWTAKGLGIKETDINTRTLRNLHYVCHTCVRRDKLKRSDISNASVEVPIPLYHFKRMFCVFWYPIWWSLCLNRFWRVCVCVCVCVYSAPLRKWNKLIVPLLFRHVSLLCCYPNEIFIQLYHCLGPISSILECFYSTNTKSSMNNWQNPLLRYRNIQSYKWCPDVY